MTTKLSTIDVSLPKDIEPIAMATSGYLRALLWESEDEFHYVICREDPETGQLDTAFHPSDVEHVVRLSAVAANVFHMVLAGELSDDLGCLAHCLSQTLGIDFDFERGPLPAKVQ